MLAKVIQLKPSYSKTTQKYLDAMKKGFLTESEIIYLRKYLGSCGSCNETERKVLLNKIADSNFPISSEQSKKGIEWLNGFTFKKNGEPRQSKQMPFRAREISVLQDFVGFTLVDFILSSDLPNGYHQSSFRQYLPIYRVHSGHGKHFDYVTNMGEITVVG